jgi:hypothetical protein
MPDDCLASGDFQSLLGTNSPVISAQQELTPLFLLVDGPVSHYGVTGSMR